MGMSSPMQLQAKEKIPTLLMLLYLYDITGISVVGELLLPKSYHKNGLMMCILGLRVFSSLLFSVFSYFLFSSHGLAKQEFKEIMTDFQHHLCAAFIKKQKKRLTLKQQIPKIPRILESNVVTNMISNQIFTIN
ncbi:hypothetical protein ATANTOWER_010095 [Ataeniobius toweri]|uniref:Uncharacterized protein n=1 Tax=Ataeniobius toweri TaxID=208326 RepID=A0ABU7C0Z2_9TELE|nr:hypothetical protein [Ataeniobius toweri]